MKKHELYDIYEGYLSTRRISESSRSLLLISRDHFDGFVDRYTGDPFFRSRYQSLFVKLVREKKLRRLSEENDKENKPVVD